MKWFVSALQLKTGAYEVIVIGYSSHKSQTDPTPSGWHGRMLGSSAFFHHSKE
jgi:hypothetical protein